MTCRPLELIFQREREELMCSRLSWLAGPSLRFLRDESGATAIEYALILALIFVVCVSAIQSFGKSTQKSLNHSVSKITGAGS